MKKILKEPSVWLLIFLVGFPQISETIYTPSLPELAFNLNATGNQIQQTLSIYFLGFALGVLLWGTLCDKIGRRLSMLFGILIYIVGSVGCLLSSSVELLLFPRLIQACGAAAGSIVTQTVMRDIYDDARRPQIFAKVSAVLAFSPAIGPLLGGIIAQYLGVKYVFICLILIGIAAIIGTYYGLNESMNRKQKSDNISNIVKRMLLDKNIWIYAGLIGIINGIIFSYYAEAPFIFINNLGFTTIQYGFLGLAVAVASFIGAIVGKKLVTYFHYIIVMEIGYIVMLIGSSVFLITAYMDLSTILSATGFVCGIFLVMAGIGIALPSCLSNALLNYKDCLGISGAFLGLLYYLTVGFITEGMSFLHNGSTLVLPIYLLVLTSVLILLALMLKTKRIK